VTSMSWGVWSKRAAWDKRVTPLMLKRRKKWDKKQREKARGGGKDRWGGSGIGEEAIRQWEGMNPHRKKNRIEAKDGLLYGVPTDTKRTKKRGETVYGVAEAKDRTWGSNKSTVTNVKNRNAVMYIGEKSSK